MSFDDVLTLAAGHGSCHDGRPMSSSPSPERAYRLRRRLLLVISLLVALVVTSGAATVLTALASRSAIQRAHDLEVASRRAALLSVVAREQYIHEAHTIILTTSTLNPCPRR